jgi:serine/threonine-protein kinase
VWIDAFVMRRFAVTNTEYLTFLNDLIGRDREDEALRFAPRERGTGMSAGPLIYGRDSTGAFELVPDADGDVWGPRWPVMMIDWHGASAYAAWQSARDGLAWRLPTELEWEKAARGVDARRYPFGDHGDASWACRLQSHRGRPLPVSVDRFPIDESVYGVRGMSGNMRTWCLDPFSLEPRVPDGARALTAAELQQITSPYRSARGGIWLGGQHGGALFNRFKYDPTYVGSDVGVRLVRSL